MKPKDTTENNMAQKRSIKQIIIRYVTALSVALGVALVILMIITSMISTSSVLRDNLQIIARISAQNIGSNVHLLADRIDNLAQKAEWSEMETSDSAVRSIITGFGS